MLEVFETAPFDHSGTPPALGGGAFGPVWQVARRVANRNTPGKPPVAPACPIPPACPIH